MLKKIKWLIQSHAKLDFASKEFILVLSVEEMQQIKMEVECFMAKPTGSGSAITMDAHDIEELTFLKDMASLFYCGYTVHLVNA